MAAKFSDRIRFNWGFYDATADAERGKNAAWLATTTGSTLMATRKDRQATGSTSVGLNPVTLPGLR